jgi:hypothetical protein
LEFKNEKEIGKENKKKRKALSARWAETERPVSLTPPHCAPLSALTVDWAPPFRPGLPRVVAPEADFLAAEAAVELTVVVGGSCASSALTSGATAPETGNPDIGYSVGLAAQRGPPPWAHRLYHG